MAFSINQKSLITYMAIRVPIKVSVVYVPNIIHKVESLNEHINF